jgi:hypothetical protein
MNSISGITLLLISNILEYKNNNRYIFIYSNFYLLIFFGAEKNAFLIFRKTAFLFTIIFSRNIIKYQLIKKF